MIANAEILAERITDRFKELVLEAVRKELEFLNELETLDEEQNEAEKSEADPTID